MDARIHSVPLHVLSSESTEDLEGANYEPAVVEGSGPEAMFKAANFQGLPAHSAVLGGHRIQQ